MKDPLFWTNLSYRACGWLRGAEDRSLRRYWVDDFLPESSTDTKLGVDVTGAAWVGEGPRVQHTYRFIVSIPQKMLFHRSRNFSIEQFMLDDVQKTIQIEVAAENQAA